jgi:signal transduction histidine kinase
MEANRRHGLVYVLLAGVWVVVMAWQVQEHLRVKDYARQALRHRSSDIASTLGSFIRGLQFRGAVFGDRLQPVIEDLVGGRNNELLASGEVISVALVNASGEVVASAGRQIDLTQKEAQEGERWGASTITFVYPIEGASVVQEGITNPAPVLLPPFTNTVREPGRGFPRRDGRPGGAIGDATPPPDPPPGPPPSALDAGGRDTRDQKPRRPFWARGMDEKEYQALIQKRELHGLVLGMSPANLYAVCRHDLWLRFIIGFFATISVVGSGLAWRNLLKSSDLQIRLVRASELNTHLKEMNVAAAGLAHETRNPLNIIRGLAHMIMKQSETPPETREKSRGIIDEADKVAAQLNEFINYSRPREVRRSNVALASVVGEVVRALTYDFEEKRLQLQTRGDQLMVEADEQLLRQALFNLLLNAAQAVEVGGRIEVVAEKANASEATLEIRDDGPGVAPEHRHEIFKPYFTTQKTGTGLGLAVVQQIVLAHGWEVQCLPNEPKGAILRISHLKLVSKEPRTELR